MFSNFQCLIGIAPHGAATFVSTMYTGSISDVAITIGSGLYDLLEIVLWLTKVSQYTKR